MDLSGGWARAGRRPPAPDPGGAPGDHPGGAAGILRGLSGGVRIHQADHRGRGWSGRGQPGCCQSRLPELAAHPDFRSLLATVLAALRGLALVDFLGREGELDRMWPGVRTQLLTLLERGP